MIEWIIILLMILPLLVRVYQIEKKFDRETKARFDAMYDPTDWEAGPAKDKNPDD